MSGILGGLRALAGWALLAAATTLVVLGLQWQAPERSVEPVADRFLCDGRLAIGSTEGTDSDFVREIICVSGRSSADDITLLTLVVLAVPVALILATSVLLFRRFLAPHQRVRRAVV